MLCAGKDRANRPEVGTIKHLHKAIDMPIVGFRPAMPCLQPAMSVNIASVEMEIKP